MEVTVRDFIFGKRNAVEKAFRSELGKFHRVVNNLNKNERICLKVLSSLSGIASSRKDVFNVVTKKYSLTDEEFDSAILSLQQKHRFIYLMRRDDNIRFTDPLMKPFLRDKLSLPWVKKDDKEEDLF